MKISWIDHVRANRPMLLLLPGSYRSQVKAKPKCHEDNFARVNIYSYFTRFIAAFLTILELGGVIYNTIILSENNQSFLLTIGHEMPNYKAYMAGIICGYIVIIAANLILIYGSMKNNRYIDQMIKSDIPPDGFLFLGCLST